MSHTNVEDCACLNLRKASRAVTAMYDAALEGSGLGGPQFSLLAILSKMEKAPMSRLAQVIVMDRTTLTRNLKPLERDGLITVTPSKDDRRVRIVALSEKGHAALRAAMPGWRKAQKKMVSMMGEKPYAQLLKGLEASVSLAHPS